jgi:uncharacterized OsmC-like protein
MALCNGVNVEDLMTAIDAVKSDPANGKLTFKVSSKWTGGFRSEHTPQEYVVGPETGKHAKDHTLSTDEPYQILGSDSGISPAETLLTSLASCLAVGYAANAAAMGINIEELCFEVVGNGSLEGFMNLRDQAPGLNGITVKTHVKSDASAEKLQELHNFVNEHSPIFDTLINPVKISSELVNS